ncbi:agamous-like MADS-box protein AGL82 [Impatiens glandulifera]|uniref:agamous-like MADS-box protein AGL82 n=1 Tax=Impatiens glandulifera TaxID=253017 RepID=UPI001FB116FE|nr:agamous-like MADS-box protein AGL82 [Impatiens glandulifera]
MGRGKLSMNLISNVKTRKATFNKRKKGLIKKAYELKTLCSIDVILIIYGPRTDESYPSQPEIWPSNIDMVKELIESYNSQPMEDMKRKTLDLSNYFDDRNKKVEDAIIKLRKNNNEQLYPIWDERYNDLTEEQLKEFIGFLQTKIEEIRVSVIMQNQSSYLPLALPAPTTMLMKDGDFYNGHGVVGYNNPNNYLVDNFSYGYPHQNSSLISYEMDNKVMFNGVANNVYCPPLGFYDSKKFESMSMENSRSWQLGHNIALADPWSSNMIGYNESGSNGNSISRNFTYI